MTESGGLECFWSNLSKHPTCPHGPTLLFGKHVNGELKQFYACSACRDRKLCNFYAEKDAKITEAQKKAWKAEAKKLLPMYNHRRLFLRFNESIAQTPERRAYCHQCSKLVLYAERTSHANHDILIGLSDEQMKNPTTILKPLSNVKKEAQYLFSTKATKELTDMLGKAGAEQVLCIGAPRIHEYITNNLQNKISSLLMDFDGRFHDFFGPLNYCWYNLFNHHFFTEEGAGTYKDFITQNSGKNTFIVCDPPFGGRAEAISKTIKTISSQYEKWNSLNSNDSLKIFFIFPYFMESIIQQKSNPSGIEGGLKDLKMSDYKVDYDNHPLFVTGSSGRKHGSPVRIFTNISLNVLELPKSDGYKYCAKCKKWISAENKHCKKCNACTSKDGRRYRHCDLCRRCVKPTWKHCETCDRCTLEKHTCGVKPTITGRCFTCSDSNHVEKDCPQRVISVEATSKSGKKRKTETNGEISSKKRKTAPEKIVKQPNGVEVSAKKQKNALKKEVKKLSEKKIKIKDNIVSKKSKEAPKKQANFTSAGVKANVKMGKTKKSAAKPTTKKMKKKQIGA